MRFPMRGASKVNLQTPQVLRLPRNSEFKISARKLWIASANKKTIRGRSEHDPSMIRPWSNHEIVISHPPLRRPDSSHLGDAFCMKKSNISRSGDLPKLHEMLRLARKMHSTLLLYSLLASIFSWHLFSLRIYSLRIYSLSIYSLGIYSLSISSRSIYSLSIYSLGIYSLGIYSFLASILLASSLSWHLFSLRIFSLFASILFASIL